MRVDVVSLAGKGGLFAHNYAAGELVLNDERVSLAEPAVISGRIIRKDGKVVVQGRIRAVARFECDRCLNPLTLPIDTEFSVEYVTVEVYEALEAAELTEEDLALSVFDGEFIDVDEIVREQVLLAVPSHAMCSENCKGLCPICGADLNVTTCTCQESKIDPRWRELEKLKLVNGK